MAGQLNRFLVALLAAMVCFAGASLGQMTKLRMSNWVPPVHHMNGTLAAWVAEVERASGGTLTVEVLPPGLAKPPGMYDLAKNGVVDISWGVPAYTPGRFPMVRVMELPFLSPSAEIGGMSLWQWYEKHDLIDKEFNDTKLILVFLHGPGVLHTKEPVTKPEDMNGMKIRAGGGGVALANAWGAVPVAVPATQAHESLQRGTSDGIFFPWEAVKGFRLEKLVAHHLEFPGGLYATPFFMTMNLASWNKLSAEHKGVLKRVGGAWGSQLMGRYWDAADHGGKQVAMENGNTVRQVSSAEFSRFKAKVDHLEGQWIEKAKEAGYDGAAMLADLKAIIKKNSD